MLAIRLSAEIEERLAALAERTGRTKTFYAREAAHPIRDARARRSWAPRWETSGATASATIA